MNAQPRIIKLTDDVTDCECCGRSGLRRTVELDFDGDRRFYGTTCAAKAHAGLGKSADIVRKASILCRCGCGEYANMATAAGNMWRSDHWKASRVAV